MTGVHRSFLFSLTGLPNTFVAAGNLVCDSSRRCERRKQAESQCCGNIALKQHLQELASVESRSVGQQRHAQETRTGVSLLRADRCIGENLRRKLQRPAAIAADITGDDLEKSGDSRPDSGKN